MGLKRLDYKVAKKRLSLLDVISGVEDAIKKIAAAYMKNSFKAECLNTFNRRRSNYQINCNEKACRKFHTWLKDKKLMVEENHIYAMLKTTRLWYRKLENTFAITSHELGETMQKLNYIDENMELEIYHFWTPL